MNNLLTYCTTFSGSEMNIWLHSHIPEFSFPQKLVERESELVVMSVIDLKSLDGDVKGMYITCNLPLSASGT